MFLLFILLQTNLSTPLKIKESTSLVRPPFEHTLGYYRATPYEVKMMFGKVLAFKDPRGLACCKLEAENTPKNRRDDRLTVYCTNSMGSQIIYNKALTTVKTYGRFGQGRGEFWLPGGIAASPEGDVYVADVENNRIVRLKNDIDSMRWIGTIGAFGCDSSEFSEPWGVTIGNNNQVWVTDKGNNRIQIFDEKGSFIKQLRNFNAPTAISMITKEDKWNYYHNEFVVVIDNKDQRIRKLGLDGNIIAGAQAIPGFKDVDFTGCAIDYYGNVWVTDKKNSCIHKFDRSLRYLDSFQDKFKEPAGITIGRRYGQVFILSKEAIDYYWVGINAAIGGCYPGVFDPREKGVTVSLTVSERARIKATIYNSQNEVIRDLIPNLTLEPFEHNISWDAKDNKGGLVQPGTYRIEIIAEPTYSSRGSFKRKLETEVVCKYK